MHRESLCPLALINEATSQHSPRHVSGNNCEICPSSHNLWQGFVAPSSATRPRRHCTCPALRNRIHQPHSPITGLDLRTGVTLSPHLFLCALPLPAAHSRRRPVTDRLLTRKDRKLHIASKEHTGTGRCNHGARRKSPRYCQSPRCERLPRNMPMLSLAHARAHTNRSSNTFLTAPLPRQPPAQWYASMSSSDMAFSPLHPLPWHHRARQDTLALHAQETWTWIWLASPL